MTDNPLGLSLDRVTARVRDIDRAVAWYRDILGFRVAETGVTPNGVMKFAQLRLHGTGISLVELDLPATEVEPGSMLLPTWVHPVFVTADAHALFHQLKGRGVEVFTRGPTPERITSFLVNDSEGNEIEILSEAGR